MTLLHPGRLHLPLIEALIWYTVSTLRALLQLVQWVMLLSLPIALDELAVLLVKEAVVTPREVIMTDLAAEIVTVKATAAATAMAITIAT